jgi:hypothetical protein
MLLNVGLQKYLRNINNTNFGFKYLILLFFFVILKSEATEKMALKNAFQNLALNSRVKKVKRLKRACCISAAKSVGFVCFFEEEDQWKKIQPSVQRLQAMGIKVMVLGIYPGKVKPLWFVETMNTLMCSIHEFGITGIPKGQKIEDFLNEELDILINCDMQEQFTTNYVSMLSPAGFKVAIDTDKTRKHFDLLIKLENPQLGAFIEQTMFYLSSFKTKI